MGGLDGLGRIASGPFETFRVVHGKWWSERGKYVEVSLGFGDPGSVVLIERERGILRT
jgi:hypothetical protein